MNAANNLYIRPTLIATRKRVTDPLALVDLWLDQLQEYVESPDDREAWYDMVALFGRLSRVRPILIKATGLYDQWLTISQTINERLAEMANHCLNLINPAGWLEEAEELAKACDDGAEADELAEWSETLLMDLDDAEVIVWAAEKAGLEEERWSGLSDQLRDCVRWLIENRDRFFPAAVFIQAVGQTIRPDLDEYDADLAGTTVKFILLLDALEEAQNLLCVPKAQGIIPVVVKGPSPITTKPRQEPPAPKIPLPAQVPWDFMPQPMFALAARGEVSPAVKRVRWWSPDGVYRAVLAVPAYAQPDAYLRVNFLRDEQPAVELVGEPVLLGGVVSVIGPEGNAEFPLQELINKRLESPFCTLAVGQMPELWFVEQTA